MDDPVLMSRLGALRNNLNVVSTNLASKAWLPDQSRGDARAELQADMLWNGLETALVTEIRARVAQVEKIEKDVTSAQPTDQAAMSAAWVRYSKLLAGSEDLLRECLEIIGTLAIRSKDLDHKILFIADELIRDCMMLSTGDGAYYLHVPSVREAISKTRARIIRVFPEWAIWDLPLASHDLGHVAINGILARENGQDEELQQMTPFINKERDSLVAMDAELNAALHNANDDAKRWATGRVRVLLADAFATYTMGPAYACAAIMLRLNPSVSASRDLPSDTQRAHVILGMLRWMNADAPMPHPYTDVVEQLDGAWQNTVQRSNPASELTAAYKAYLDQLAQEFGREVSWRTLNGTAKYPYKPANEGWTKAQEWAALWREQWQNNRALGVPDNPTGKLRDVLNAAWLCRLGLGANDSARAQAQVAQVGQELCNALLKARAAGQRGAVPAPATV